ncbi:MAG TPA: ComF family protein [Gammaproteobacteria bacterium]|nr:ComF family protein [Gammaproteobacteria bacterium]
MAVNLFQYFRVNKRPFFPRYRPLPAGLCYLCDTVLHKFDYLICRDCVRDLPFITHACPVCALPGPANVVCADCLNSKRLFINRSISVFRYEYPVNRLILDLKFHARLPLAGFFARMLALMASGSRIALPDVFLPVPLHGSRLAIRGFNQSRLVAGHLSALTGVPLDSHYCRRIRHTLTQSGLPASTRRRNLKGAFTVITESREAPRHVGIVDDVVTTGTTAGEMAKALTEAGVKQIDVWSCSRAG